MTVAGGGAWTLEFLKSHPGSSNTWSRLSDTGPPTSSKATKRRSRSTSFLFLSLEVQFPEDIKGVSYLKLNWTQYTLHEHLSCGKDKAQSTTVSLMAIQLNHGVIQAPRWVYNRTIVYKEIPQRWEGEGLTGRETLMESGRDSLGSEGKCPESTEEMDEEEQRKQRGRLLSLAFYLEMIIIHKQLEETMQRSLKCPSLRFPQR